MRTILHILTAPDSALAEKVIALQQASPDHQVQRVDLTRADADYPALVEDIFTADSVQVW